MKRFTLLIVCLLMLPLSLLAKKVSYVETDVVLRATPDERARSVARVAAGDVVILLEEQRPDYWIKVQVPSGSIGYVDSAVLTTPGGRELTEEEVQAGVGEVVSQAVVPRDGAYEVVRKGMTVYLGAPYSKERREDTYQPGDLLTGVKYVNKDWLAMPLGADTGYVQRKYVRKLWLYELVRTYGKDSPVVAAEREAIDRAPKLTVFNGLRSGLYGVWLVVAAAVAAVLATLYSLTIWAKNRARTATVCGLLLVLTSLLEIWYFLSLGTDDVGWFLGKTAGDYAWINFFIMLAVTAAQGFGLFSFVGTVQELRGFRFSQRWMFGGIILSLILYGVWYLTKMNVEIPSSAHAPVLVLCAVVGQIPQVSAMLIGFWRHRRTRLPGKPSIVWTLLVYWVSLVGLVCLGGISIGLLAAMAVCVIVMFCLLREMPKMFFHMVTNIPTETKQSQYDSALERLSSMMKRGDIGTQQADHVKQRLDEDLSKKDGNPGSVNF